METLLQRKTPGVVNTEEQDTTLTSGHSLRQGRNMVCCWEHLGGQSVCQSLDPQQPCGISKPSFSQSAAMQSYMSGTQDRKELLLIKL